MTVVPDLPPLAFFFFFFFVDFFPLGDGYGARGEQTSALDTCLSILYTLNHASLTPAIVYNPRGRYPPDNPLTHIRPFLLISSSSVSYR